MVRFEANLSSSSLEKLISQLDAHGKKLIQAQNLVLQALADYVYERIIYYIDKQKLIRTGQLRGSFMKEVSSDIARVYTDLYYAKYVEFGTGIRGKGSGYDTKYMGEDSYSPEFQGQVAQKFIYKAVQDLERDYVEIATNVLREKGLI